MGKFLLFLNCCIAIFALGPLLKGAISNLEYLNGQLKLLAASLLLCIVLLNLVHEKGITKGRIFLSNLVITEIIIAAAFLMNAYGSEIPITSKYHIYFCGLLLSILFMLLIKKYNADVFLDNSLMAPIIVSFFAYKYVFPYYFNAPKYLNIFSYLFLTYIGYQSIKLFIGFVLKRNPKLVIIFSEAHLLEGGKLFIIQAFIGCAFCMYIAYIYPQAQLILEDIGVYIFYTLTIGIVLEYRLLMMKLSR